MDLAFDVDDTHAVFHRDSVTGRAELRLGDETVALESPYRPSTHFSLSTRTTWRHSLDGRLIAITRRRPRFFGGFRRSRYQVDVDGQVVAAVTAR